MMKKIARRKLYKLLPFGALLSCQSQLNTLRTENYNRDVRKGFTVRFLGFRTAKNGGSPEEFDWLFDSLSVTWPQYRWSRAAMGDTPDLLVVLSDLDGRDGFESYAQAHLVLLDKIDLLYAQLSKEDGAKFLKEFHEAVAYALGLRS